MKSRFFQTVSIIVLLSFASCSLVKESYAPDNKINLQEYLGMMMHSYYLIHYQFPTSIESLLKSREDQPCFYDRENDSILVNNAQDFNIIEFSDTTIMVQYKEYYFRYQDSINLDEINNTMRRCRIYGFDEQGKVFYLDDKELKSQITQLEKDVLLELGKTIPQYRDMPTDDGGPLIIVLRYFPQVEMIEFVPSCKFALQKLPHQYLSLLKSLFSNRFQHSNLVSVLIPIMYIE